MRTSKRAGIIATAVAFAIGCGASAPTRAGTFATNSTLPYTLAATSRCLVQHGAKVGPIQPLDKRLRAMRDLAQRNSIEADFKSGRVGIAFSKSESDARLLLEVLVQPNDPYRLVRRGNAVLLYRPAHKRAFAIAVGCLR